MANDLPVSYTITRSELSLSTLQLNTTPGNNYRVITDSMGTGDISHRRLTADSPWVPGETLVASVKEQVSMPLGIRVTAASNAALKADMTTVVNAFSQFSYTITVTLDSQTWGVYSCQPADFSIGDSGNYQNLQMITYRQEIYLQIPRNPIISTGVA